MERLIITDWLPDYPGQTADQKTREFATTGDANPLEWWQPEDRPSEQSSEERRAPGNRISGRIGPMESSRWLSEQDSRTTSSHWAPCTLARWQAYWALKPHRVQGGSNAAGVWQNRSRKNVDRTRSVQGWECAWFAPQHMTWSEFIQIWPIAAADPRPKSRGRGHANEDRGSA